MKKNFVEQQRSVPVNRLQSVDVVRLFAIIAVISIHTEPFSSPSYSVGDRLDVAIIINQAARFAVPFFFILSGYFWARKIAAGATVISSTLPMLKKLALLLFGWSIIYLFPIDSLAFFEYGIFGPIKKAYWNLNSALNKPFDIVLEGTMHHLWFLPALACSLVLSALLLHYKQKWLLFPLAIVLFLTGLAGGAYRGTPFGFESDFNFRNGPFFSLIFFVSGYLLSAQKANKTWLPIGVASACLGACLQFYEVLTLNAVWGLSIKQDYVFGTYFFGMGIAIIALSNPKFLRCSRAAAIGRLVLGIYASHVIFATILLPINKEFRGNWVWSILYVVLVFFSSYILTSFLARFNATKKLVM